MSQAVLVFSFPEPEDSVSLGLIIEAAKKSFSNMDEMKIHMGINDVAKDVISIFDPLHASESNLVKHARRELALIEQDTEDPAFAKAIIKAITAFSSYGHSGGSAAVGISMLCDLLKFNNLSPLTDNQDEWENIAEGVWQNRRNGEAFSHDSGKTYYLLSEGGRENNPQPIHYSATYVKEESGP